MTYLQKLRAEYLRRSTAVTQLRQAAVDANRDLTAVEEQTITDHVNRCNELYPQIEAAAQQETRASTVSALATTIPGLDDTENANTGEGTQNRNASDPAAAATDGTPAGGGTQMRNLAGGGAPATTAPRDPGHYRQGGAAAVEARSFFSDLYRSLPTVHNDTDARKRLAEHTAHMRALTTVAAGSGIVPPRWLTEEYDKIARQSRAVANAVRQIDLAGNPAPLTLPKQVAGTDAVVAEQAQENDPVAGTDAFDTDVDVVIPRPTAGKQIVSRQMLEAGSPAADALIFADLLDVYNLKVEYKVGAALVAAAGTAVTTFATEAAFAAQGAAWDAAVDIAIEVWDKRKFPADFYTSGVKRWGAFKKLKDADGRPLIPARSGGLVNVIGQGDTRSAGDLDGLPYIPTDGVSITGTYPQSVLAVRASDTILFEDSVRRFRFDEQVGPESIVLGVWGYTAVIVRQVGKSVKRFVVTAA